MSDFSALIRPECVLIEPDVDTAADVIGLLGGVLVSGGFGKETLVDAALDRERHYPTGLLLDADGVNAAIPHADREHVKAAAVAVAVLAKPVQFRRMDVPDAEIPVRVVFLLALPDADSQIQTLRALAGALQNPDLIARLVASTTPEELIARMAESGAST